jgi:hypothetical protein
VCLEEERARWRRITVVVAEIDEETAEVAEKRGLAPV